MHHDFSDRININNGFLICEHVARYEPAKVVRPHLLLYIRSSTCGSITDCDLTSAKPDPAAAITRGHSGILSEN